MSASPWMTVTEAAEYMRRSVKTVYKLVEEGRLPAYYPDRRPLIKQQDIDRLIMSKAGRR